MISLIFGKTKPINFIIVLTFLFFFYWFVHFQLFDRGYGTGELWHKALILGVLFFSIFLVNFIVKRNKITRNNSFSILFYAMLAVVFPETLLDSNAILCSFFLLLATRRIISMRSSKDTKFKIFDATIWVLVSSLFYDWAILYLILVFAAIFFYQANDIRNWLVPFAGIFTVYMIAKSILILANQKQFLVTHYQFNFSVDVAYFTYWGHSTKLILFAVITFLTGLLAFVKLGKAGFGRVVTMRLIAFSFVIGLLVNILKLSDNVYPVIITFLPAVILMTKYIESIRRARIREILLIASIIIPFAVLLTGMAIQ
ncbi:MAG TPA: hypothetical protein ENH87_04655 [Pricia antarctica]|uniref:EpsG family protein n=2 Tax=root TaxID=1 RepID=A0A831QL46_9FLAO|nr:hypothetical protein [Pricia antarctica]